jgi:hypothetical protein
MTPKKFKKICKRYFIDSAFTMEDISSVADGSIIISVFFCGFGVLRYCGGDDKERPFLLIADKFRYNENYGKIVPCRNDGSFIGIWCEYTKLYNVGHNSLIKIILSLIEKIKIAKVEYKKQLIEKDFENEG